MQPFSKGCFHRLGCALYQQQPLQRFARGRVVLLVVVESSWSYPAFVLFLFFKYFVPSSASPLEGDDPLLWTRVSSSRGSCHPLLSFLPLSNCPPSCPAVLCEKSSVSRLSSDPMGCVWNTTSVVSLSRCCTRTWCCTRSAVAPTRRCCALRAPRSPFFGTVEGVAGGENGFHLTTPSTDCEPPDLA